MSAVCTAGTCTLGQPDRGNLQRTHKRCVGIMPGMTVCCQGWCGGSQSAASGPAALVSHVRNGTSQI